ncbi:hypothetical protein K466DRAFT_605534 [Polyporus arcularius HHB13444]|uniref:Uncharacterized protein n=1 Tax=Polyporus arcularius HHB13444 TaxID=1314778 RepID=A0A5C3NT65_9APHY|nr:hypothetical protein K466DRAFT_605534 [Polyporus arcularius HHB13444]
MANPHPAPTVHSTLIPSPSNANPLLLIARWKGLLRPSPGVEKARLRHAYTLAIWPDESIVIGKTVKILAAAPISHHLPQSPPNQYDTYDPHIVGRVTAVWRLENGVAVARIVNICGGNMVEEVELEFPYLLQKGCRPERRASGKEIAETTAEEGLDLITKYEDAHVS